MLFQMKENEILILIEDFLKTRQLLYSLRSLEKESKVVLGNLDGDTLFLRDLVMDGEWTDVLEYLNPLRDNVSYDKIRLMIEKQRYLELLATERGNYDAGLVMKTLSVLEDLCPTRHEYTSLCYLLTRPHLTQHPAYADWSQYHTRLQCFEEIKTSLLQQETREDCLPSTERLVDLLTKGLFYESALQLCSQKLAPGGCSNVSDALTNNLLTCTVADKEAILLHWIYKIPASALAKPAKTKIVQVELEPRKRPRSARPTAATRSSAHYKSRDHVSCDLQTPRDQQPSVYSSINRDTYPLTPRPHDNSVGVSSDKDSHNETTDGGVGTTQLRNDSEITLGDSEVPIEERAIDIDDCRLVLVPSATALTSSECDDNRPRLIHRNSTPEYMDVMDRNSSPLLDMKMGFTDALPVEMRDCEVQKEEGEEGRTNGTTEISANINEETTVDSDQLRCSNDQEEKIRWLQQQLNELRMQQDSLRVKSAIQEADKKRNGYTSKGAKRMVHDASKNVRDTSGKKSPMRMPDAPCNETSREVRDNDRPAETSCDSVGVAESSNDTIGLPSEVIDSDRVVTHSAAADRGTDPPPTRRKPAVPTGWIEGAVSHPSSLHTLESFSEDSLRPCSTSTPSKPVKTATNKVADSAMLKVKFTPSAVLEDVQPIRCASFHPGGDLIAIGSNSKALRVCSCHMLSDSVQTLVREDGCQDLPVLFKRNRHHKGSVYSVAWNSTGTVLATGSNDKTIVAVGFDADNCISTGTDREFSFHKGTVRNIHFLDETQMLSAGGGDNLLHLTDIEKGVEVAAYSGHTATIHTVTSHRDMFVTGSEDATIRLWDRRSNSCTRVVGAAIGAKGNSCVGSISLNNYGNLLCVSRDDGLCMFYDIEMGKLLAAFSPHSPAPCKSVQFYRNPRYILSGSYDGTVALTCAEQVLLNPDVPCTEILGTHRDKVTMVTWHPTKQAFATCSADRTACLWSARDGVQD